MKSMTEKQRIYLEILERTLPWLRNVSTWSWWQRCRDRSVYHETALIHNLYVSLFEPEFVDHDISFLNSQARGYCEQCSKRVSPLYPEQVQRIKRLFALVPDRCKGQLSWSGPE